MKTMMKRIVLSVLVLFVVVQCGGKKEVRPIPPEAELTEKALSVIETIKGYYVRKDLQAIKGITTDRGYLDIIAVVKDFDTATVTFKPLWVDIKGETVVVRVQWEGAWFIKGKRHYRKGTGEFVLKGPQLRVDEIRGANPFEEPL